MKKQFTSKTCIALLVALLMVLSMLPTMEVATKAASLTQSQFDAKLSSAKSAYPEGSQKYEWAINGSVVGWQCHGYARWLSWYVWGTDFANGYGANWTLYKSTATSTDIGKLSPGDVVRYRTSTANTYNHTIFVTKITGDTIYFTDCNFDGKNTIRWNRTMSRTTLNNYLKISLYGSESAPYGYIAHYTLNTLSAEALKIDTRYPTPFKCRILSTVNIPGYNSIGGTSPGDVFVDDDCVIREVYTNGWCKFDCPWFDGTTKTLYCKITEFVNMNITPQTMSAPAYAKTYLHANDSAEFGWIDAGDSITKLSVNGNRTQIVYPVPSGKWCAWVDSSAITKKYTVSYNANGGSGAPASQTKTQGIALTLSTAKPTRTGYTFLGWSTNKNASSAVFAAGAKFTTDADTTLYAVWKPNTYTVKYNANGGSGTMADSAHTYNTDKALLPNAFTKTDYAFLGWSTSTTAEAPSYTDKQSVRNLTSVNGGTVTLYAVWKQVVFLDSISVETDPEKTLYKIGEEFESTGLTLKLNYSDGSNKIISNGFTVSGFDSKIAGSKTMTVSYEGKQTTFLVKVSDLEVTLEGNAFGVYTGSLVKFTASADGGAGGYTYKYVIRYDGKEERIHAADTSMVCRYKMAKPGTKEVIVIVTDEEGVEATASYVVTVR